MRKLIAIVIIVFLALPVYQALKPKPFDPKGFLASIEASGYTVSEVKDMDPPDLESVKHVQFKINGDYANLYQYDDRGKLNLQASYQHGDSGSAIVESMGLREALGAAPNPNKHVEVAKNGMWMLTVFSDDRGMCNKAVALFNAS